MDGEGTLQNCGEAVYRLLRKREGAAQGGGGGSTGGRCSLR